MNKQTIKIISFMTLITLINNLAHPVTPELVSSIGYGSFLLGTLFAVMSMATFFMSPFWGRFSDKYGRKIGIIIALVGYGLSQLGFGFSTKPSIIIVFRLLAGGINCASQVAGLAYLVDVTSLKERTKAMALYTALTGFSSTLGYLIGGLVGNNDYHNAFILQSTLCFITAVLVIFFLEESHKETVIKKKTPFISSIGKYRYTIVPLLLVITMITSFFSTGFNNGFNSYMKFVLNLGPKYIGIIMAITGLIGLLMNILIFPLIKRFINDYHTLTFSIVMMVIFLTLAMYFETHNFTTSLILLIFFFAFLAIYKPVLQSIISKLGNANGEIMGLNNAFTALGNVGGSFYAGAVFAYNVNLTFYSLALIHSLALILLLIKRKKLMEYGW